MTIQVDPETLDQAIDGLGVRGTPIYSAIRAVGGRIELWLCGHTQPVFWTPAAKKPATKVNFTKIPGVGPTTNTSLRTAGINTWRKLRRASDQKLLEAGISPRATGLIRSYLESEMAQETNT